MDLPQNVRAKDTEKYARKEGCGNKHGVVGSITKEISETVLDKIEAQIVSEIVGDSFPLLKNQILWLKEHSDSQV